MKRKLFSFILLIFISGAVFSNNLYKFKPDNGWRKLQIKDKVLCELYEVSGILLKHVYNDGPLAVTIFIFKMGKAKNPEDIDKIWKENFFKDNDRIYYNNSPLRTINETDRGIEIYLYSNFFRKSKDLYQTRFEFISISPKTGEAINLTVSIQHNDQTFNIDKELQLKNIADYVFAKFSLKK